MPDAAPHFDDQGRLIAPKYDDVYFSAEDGLAETRHVFLEGNHLAERFAAMKPGTRFTIGETGFGTGLNFLAAWQLFEQYAPADAQLEFVSVEGLPLGAEQIRRALSPWQELLVYRDALLQQWGPLWLGMHRFRFSQGRVRLILLVGEVARVLHSIGASVDAWFLDGFAPSRNPEMWSEAVFIEIGRLSASEATLATYTAAGFVRRGLESVGFDIEKQPGFGTKRDMTVGQLKDPRNSLFVPPQSVVVIGGSIAGAFVARSLAERGVDVTLIERQSLYGNLLPSLQPRVAVLQPKINDLNDPTGRWLREGYAYAYRLLQTESRIRNVAYWRRTGTFQAAHDARSQRRLERFITQFEASGLCRWIDPKETIDELGVDLSVGGVVVEAGGTLSPAGLCRGLLEHPRIEVRDGVTAKALHLHRSKWVTQVDGKHNGASSDAVVVANAIDALAFKQTRHLPLTPIRGQVSDISASTLTESLRQLKRPIFYGGYVIPGADSQIAIGASFVPNDRDLHWRYSEHEACCDKLASLLPEQAVQLRSIDQNNQNNGWVGLRTTTPKHRAYAEQVEQGLYVSLGHGSHGIASAAQSGEHLASMMMGAACIRNEGD